MSQSSLALHTPREKQRRHKDPSSKQSSHKRKRGQENSGASTSPTIERPAHKSQTLSLVKGVDGARGFAGQDERELGRRDEYKKKHRDLSEAEKSSKKRKRHGSALGDPPEDGTTAGGDSREKKRRRKGTSKEAGGAEDGSEEGYVVNGVTNGVDLSASPEKKKRRHREGITLVEQEVPTRSQGRAESKDASSLQATSYTPNPSDESTPTPRPNQTERQDKLKKEKKLKAQLQTPEDTSHSQRTHTTTPPSPSASSRDRQRTPRANPTTSTTTIKAITTATSTDPDPEDDISTSPFKTTTASLLLPLSPISLARPLAALCAEHLSPLLLTYFPPAGGILLSYQDARLSNNPPTTPSSSPGPAEPALALVHDTYAPPLAWLTATLTLFSPAPTPPPSSSRTGNANGNKNGSDVKVKGIITLQSESHIALTCYNLFPASITSTDLPRSWRWVPSSSSPRDTFSRAVTRNPPKRDARSGEKQNENDNEWQGEQEEQEEDPEQEETGGYYFDDGSGQAVEVGAAVRFRVLDYELGPFVAGGPGGGAGVAARGRALFGIWGSLVGVETPGRSGGGGGGG